MSLGRALLIAAAVGVGLVLLARSSDAAPLGPPPPGSPGTAPTGKVTGGFVQTGPVLPQLAPIYSALRPIANHLTTPLINTLNRAAGGSNPYGAPTDLKVLPSGEVQGTDGLGATVVFHKDGTITRHNPSFSQTSGGKFVIGAGHALEGAGNQVVSAGKSALHFVEGLF